MIGTIWNTIIFHPILNLLIIIYFFAWQNLGIAIIIITGLIRFLLTPSTYKQVTMGVKLKKLSPRLKELQAKYKTKPQELAKAQAALYKEMGYSPLGCFGNLLIQLPILIALYQSVLAFTKTDSSQIDGLYQFTQNILQTDKLVFNTHFWGMDLLAIPSKVIGEQGFFTSAGLPFVILIILLVVIQIIANMVTTNSMNPPATKDEGSNKTKPTTNEPNMEDISQNVTKMTTYIFPFVIAFSLIQAPAILSFYWIVQSIIGIFQQYAIMYVYRIRHPEMLSGDAKLAKK